MIGSVSPRFVRALAIASLAAVFSVVSVASSSRVGAAESCPCFTAADLPAEGCEAEHQYGWEGNNTLSLEMTTSCSDGRVAMAVLLFFSEYNQGTVGHCHGLQQRRDATPSAVTPQEALSCLSILNDARSGAQ